MEIYEIIDSQQGHYVLEPQVTTLGACDKSDVENGTVATATIVNTTSIVLDCESKEFWTWSLLLEDLAVGIMYGCAFLGFLGCLLSHLSLIRVEYDFFPAHHGDNSRPDHFVDPSSAFLSPDHIIFLTESRGFTCIRSGRIEQHNIVGEIAHMIDTNVHEDENKEVNKQRLPLQE